MPRFFKGKFSSMLEKNRAQIRQGAFDDMKLKGYEFNAIKNIAGAHPSGCTRHFLYKSDL